MDPMTERAIAERARSQLGLITYEQLTQAGMSRTTRLRRVRSGLLVPMGTRTLLLAGAPISREVEVLAACLDLDGVASHRTAAWLRAQRPEPPQLEITVLRGRSSGRTSTTARLQVHTSTNLPADDIVWVGAIPVTSVARTLLDLAGLPPSEVSHADLVAMVEDTVRRGLASDRWLWWLLEQRRCRGRNGVGRFERVLVERASLGPTESWLEREVLRILGEAGLPLPTVQHRVSRRGAFVARVDFAYAPLDIVLEALGHAHHSGREQLSADAARASQLTLLGLDVHQFTYDQIVGRPDWVVSVVRAALANAMARAGSHAA